MRIRWTTPAAEDLEGIKGYLDAQYPSFSRPTIRKLYRAVRSLKTMPERGRIGLRAGTRELVVHPLPYIIVYWIKQEAIEILRIHHGAQDRTR
jgi:toxin ParE1/3/4